MEMSKVKEGETSARIVPKSNGIGDDQVKFNEESRHNHKTVVCNGNHRAPVRNFWFSTYLSRSNDEQISDTPLEGNSAHNQIKEVAIACNGGVGNRGPALENGPEKPHCYSKKVIKDTEISIFEAKKYFGSQEEKKTDTNHGLVKEGCKVRENSNSKAKTQESKNKLLLSNNGLYDPCTATSSPASSKVVVNPSFRSGGSTPSTPSEASWNSQSGLLSRVAGNYAIKKPPSDRKRTSEKWSIGCMWPCWRKKSVELEDTVTEFGRTPSVSHYMVSTELMDSPVSSRRHNYLGLGKRVFGRSFGKQRTEATFVDNTSQSRDMNGGSTVRTFMNPPAVDNLQRNSALYDRDCEQQHLGERPDHRRGARSSSEHEGFSFPILSVGSQESLGSPLEVFGSPFPGTPNCEETHISTSGMTLPQLIQPSDLHRRLWLFSVERARKSFNFDSNPDLPKFGRNNNEDGDDDKRSDSSSDLFEIDSFVSQGTASYPYSRRDSLDNALTSSVQHYCYEPTETRDNMSEEDSRNFSSRYEDLKSQTFLPGLKEARSFKKR
ncbi:hypothetical protein SUGI_1063320 [Cryptomeria japonica]|uniref:uncharacterized protein LOC131028450 n=1 Tax=Cryptomeria japonica TaxID=3369 RepID=UPI0024146C92|nr:uncharacterized protein LOC131028450 [Cryptomeria japonica]GLJ49994.1 hypothetical protein SUGI_1063320 [Cryptomeria japonica]